MGYLNLSTYNLFKCLSLVEPFGYHVTSQGLSIFTERLVISTGKRALLCKVKTFNCLFTCLSPPLCLRDSVSRMSSCSRPRRSRSSQSSRVVSSFSMHLIFVHKFSWYLLSPFMNKHLNR